MTNLSPKVSIIIPVYNIEAYLPETLDSVLLQTYQNLEILLVDDGSTDSSGAICDRYAANDSRFLVFHRNNSGVSASRNYALDHVSGEYCVFIDADDLVKEKYIEDMVDIALKTASPLIVCSFMDGKYHSPKEFSFYRTSEQPAFHQIPVHEYRYTNAFAHDTVWGGLFRTELIGDLRFDHDLFVGEDTVFFSRILRRARSLIYVEEKYYYYTYRYSSLARREYSRRLYTEVLAWERVCSEASEEDPVFLNECYVALAIRCRKNYDRAMKAHYPDQDLLKALVHRCFDLRKNVYHSKERTVTEKMKYALFLCFPRLFTKLKLKAKSDL